MSEHATIVTASADIAAACLWKVALETGFAEVCGVDVSQDGHPELWIRKGDDTLLWEKLMELIRLQTKQIENALHRRLVLNLPWLLVSCHFFVDIGEDYVHVTFSEFHPK